MVGESNIKQILGQKPEIPGGKKHTGQLIQKC